MTNLLTFPDAIGTLFFVLIVLWALAEVAERLWPSEPVDEIREERSKQQ